MKFVELSEKDEELLDKASKTFDTQKYGGFLVRWANALESYGTPRDFVYETYYEDHSVTVLNGDFNFKFVIAPGNERRREFIAKQEQYIPKDSLDSYGVRLDKDVSACFLCENVIQGIDANNYPEEIGDNVVIDLGNHYILPNRYPSEFGHSLSVRKDHDDMTDRVIPDKDTGVFEPTPGKTRGGILTADYLEALIEGCDMYQLAGLRNHSLEGMSLYKHEHFHVFFEDSPRYLATEKVTDLRTGTAFGSNVYAAFATPFDTLIIEKKEGKPISDFAVPLLENMEKDNQIFTLIYYKGMLLVSPRKAENFDDKRQQVGACMPIHAADVPGKETDDVIAKYMPLRGEFPWEKYAP